MALCFTALFGVLIEKVLKRMDLCMLLVCFLGCFNCSSQDCWYLQRSCFWVFFDVCRGLNFHVQRPAIRLSCVVQRKVPFTMKLQGQSTHGYNLMTSMV